MTATDEWLNHSVCFRKIHEDLSRLEPDKPTKTEIKLYSKEQFRTHINRVYPFHLDHFTSQLSALDFEQHRMGLYIFYDVNQGYLINDLDKESNKKTSRGKNIKRMNGLLLNEHRMFNECAKEYAVQHLQRDYQAIKAPVKQFMQTWLQRKSDVIRRTHEQFFVSRMRIPLDSYDSINPVTFDNCSTVLRVGTIPLLSIPEKLDQKLSKCSDNRDRLISDRFNPAYRLTNLVDDANLLAILSEHSSIDVVLCQSSFLDLIELFAETSLPISFPMSIREFQFDVTTKKKVIFFDKPLRHRRYTARQLNTKFSQRSFRSFLLSQTGGKRELTNKDFHLLNFNDRTEYSICEVKCPKIEPKVIEPTPLIEDEEEEEEDDDQGMVISTDGDIEEQQKLFHKSKQKIIHSAPILQERIVNPEDLGPVPVVSQVKLVTPVQGNYSYSLWQLGTLQLLVRSSFHGFTRSNTSEEELLTCYAKLEYQPQFGFEQITDAEYRRLWLQSYLRQGTSLLLGRINAFTQQVMKVEKITFENLNQNLKECQIDMLKPLTKVYGLLYGLQSLEVKNYVLASPLNEVHLDLYEASNEATTFDLHAVDSPMLVEGDQEIVPWIPLTPTLLLPFHLEFERIPLTFCPRHKRCYDIELTVPPRRQPRIAAVVGVEEKKKRKRLKKKKAQQRKKTTTTD